VGAFRRRPAVGATGVAAACGYTSGGKFPRGRQARRVGLRLGRPGEAALTFVPFQNCLLSAEPGQRTDWGTI
jgi:hypothetical protein